MNVEFKTLPLAEVDEETLVQYKAPPLPFSPLPAELLSKRHPKTVSSWCPPAQYTAPP